MLFDEHTTTIPRQFTFRRHRTDPSTIHKPDFPLEKFVKIIEYQSSAEFRDKEKFLTEINNAIMTTAYGSINTW